MTLPTFPTELLHAVRTAQQIAVLTGAGISAESGIPTFRDTLTGLWQRFDASALATPHAFARNPALVWGWYEWRRMKIEHAQPNAAHLALAQWEKQRSQQHAPTPSLTIITQNVDNLHERAGSSDIIHLHGELFAPRCSQCQTTYHFPHPASEPETGRELMPPHCPHCHHFIRPGVVWFGEALPESAYLAAAHAAIECDVMLIIGTSGLVYPAAHLPQLARQHGATLVQINPHPNELDTITHWNLHGAAGDVLPALLNAL